MSRCSFSPLKVNRGCDIKFFFKRDEVEEFSTYCIIIRAVWLSASLPVNPPITVPEAEQSTQTVGHVILALIRSQAQLGKWCYCDITKKVARKHVSPLILLPKSLVNMRRHPLFLCLTQISSNVDIGHERNWGKLTDGSYLDGSSDSVSLWAACPVAGC